MEIRGNEESELIKKNSDQLGFYGRYWLGLMKIDSTWIWENEGSADYTHWESGEPNDHCDNGPPCNCAAIFYSTMEWKDESCAWHELVLCESNSNN